MGDATAERQPPPPAEIIRASATILAALPKHDAGLTIERNPGRVYYEDVSAWLASLEGEPDWPSSEARQRAIESNDVWVMQWYPNTPVGFSQVAAPTLAELIAAVAP